MFIKNVDERSVYVSQNLHKYRMFVMIFQQENLCHSLDHRMALFEWPLQCSHLLSLKCQTVWKK